MKKPLVVHYLWYLRVGGRFIIACGKRDPYEELKTTCDRELVTCTRCLNTQRYKGPT